MKPECTDWPGTLSVVDPLGANAASGPPVGSVPTVTVCGVSGLRLLQVTVSPTCTTRCSGVTRITARGFHGHRRYPELHWSVRPRRPNPERVTGTREPGSPPIAGRRSADR